jgi:hypothetical protein
LLVASLHAPALTAAPGATPDYADNVVNGAVDLKDFFPVVLDLKQLLTVLPPSAGVKYTLRQEDSALNFVYTNLTRATAFGYLSAPASGFGPAFTEPAATATTQQITAAGVELSAGFLNLIGGRDAGVILVEGRQLSDKPLKLVVEKDGTAVTETVLNALGLRRGKIWETSNKANQIFNPTKKDDSTGTKLDANGRVFLPEVEGDATYGVPRNILYVVAGPADNKLRVSLDLGIPPTVRPKFMAAAWDGSAKVPGSDTHFPAEAGQPANMEIAAASGAETREYQIRIGVDADGNGLLDNSEASPYDLYRRKDTGEVRFATVKGISSAKYEAHKQVIENGISAYGLQSQPTGPLKYSRSFLALFYYNGNFISISPTVQPSSAGTQQLDAFVMGNGFTEWLTHNSGAAFTNAGQATIQEYRWDNTSDVSEFFAARTPFALESTITNAQGYYEFQTSTGIALKTFYEAQVETAAEQALQNSPVGMTLTFPLDGGWYEFPRTESPNLFKSISPGNWVTPSTQLMGSDDGYGGWKGALFSEIVTGGDEFKEYDAFATLGRGRVLNPRYRITVKKEDNGIIFPTIEYKVSEVLFECAVEDLYDFNYEDGTLPSHAAAMQIGWGKDGNGAARDQGKIYRHHINIRHSYPYPFYQTAIMNPVP